MYERKDIPSANPEAYMPKCDVIHHETKERCGAPAPNVVRFADKTSVRACANCALHLSQTAKAHNSSVRVITP